MCHLKALPGDPGYDARLGMHGIVESARKNLKALQDGGVDAIMFSNEASLPYLTKVETITTACMARVIAELRSEIRVPFGVNVLWDPAASIDLAVATGGLFVREIFTGVYASDYGMWNTDCGAVIRHQHAVHGQHVKLLFNIVPESAVYMAERHIVDIAKSTVFVSKPDALCVSGITAGAEASLDTLRQVKAGSFEAVERRELTRKWEEVLRELRGLDATLTSARNTGRHDIAISTLERLESIDRLSRGFYMMARFEIVFLEKLDSQAAFKIARGALETDADSAQLLNDLSWTILTGEGARSRDLPLAQKLAERAVEVSEGKNPHFLDTLARAHADQGRLEEAIKQQKRAVDRAGDASEREEMLATLQEYMRKREGR